MRFLTRKTDMVDRDRALSGRDEPIPTATSHEVLGTPIKPPFPDGYETAIFGLGCFWGAEKDFWETPGVVSTAAGYAGGYTPNADYAEVCSGKTGQAEVVRVVFDPQLVSYEQLLRVFWENHDPTQGMRQGNDIGTQYRSAIYPTTDDQLKVAEATKATFQDALSKSRYGEITTEIAPLGDFFYAEPYHQQYLAKNPRGYCPIHATGVKCG